MKHDIFVSYSRTDQKLVVDYVSKMEQLGYKVWFDRDISHGHSFPDEIAKAIEDSRLVLFFSSEASNSSRWVKREVIYADSCEKTIIPVLLDKSGYNTNFRLLFSGVEHIDASSNPVSATDDLLVAIKKEIGQRNGGVCVAIGKVCPEGAILDVDRIIHPVENSTDNDTLIRGQLRSEALLFTSICTFVWVTVLTLCGSLAGLLSTSFWTLFLVSSAFLSTIYLTCITTNSNYVPGWYNRNLTTYGAMILTLDGFVVALALSISAVISSFGVISLLLVVSSVLGVTAVSLLFSQKKMGYVLMWVTGIVLSATSSLIPAAGVWKLIALFVVAAIYSLMMILFGMTLKLSHNGTSTWYFIFGRSRKENRGFRKVESALLRLWFRIYR